MKGLFTPTLLIAALSLSGCDLTSEDKKKLDNAAVDLEQLADQIKILNPVNGDEITESYVDVRAYIPPQAGVTKVSLWVQGIEVGQDTDGEPWEIEWPAHYWADGKQYSLLLTAETSNGNTVHNIQETSVTVNTSANKALTFEEGFNGRSIQEQGSLSFTFSDFEDATGYELLVDGELLTTDTAGIELNNLDVGTHTVQYRVLHDRLDSTPFSEVATFEVLPATLPTINEPVIDGISVTLSWDSIAEDDSYDIYWGPEDSTLELLDNINTNSYTFAEEETGNFEWSIRRTNTLGQQSLMSPKTVVELLPPALPVMNEPEIEYKDEAYQVTLSWEVLEEGDSYTVYFGKQSESLQAQTATTKSSMVISGLELGQYQWQLQRTNAFSQSVTSATIPISAGVFKLQLGGSGDDYGRQIITSKDGGSIILARTKSKGDSQGDDWIIKLNSNGGIEWEYVLEKSGYSRLKELREFSDGSLYAIGSNSNSDDRKGYLIKLFGEASVENRLAWESEYRSDNAEKEYFSSLTELNGKLYIIGTAQDCISTSCTTIAHKLYNFNPTTGILNNSINLPDPEGALLDELGYLNSTTDDKLIIACTAKPEVVVGGYFQGACLLNIDSTGQLNWSWHSIGSYTFTYGEFVTEAPWGDFVLTGAGQPLSTSFAIFNSGGELLIKGQEEGEAAGRTDVATFNNEEILRLISDGWTGGPAQLWSTNQNGYTEVIKEFTNYSPVSLATTQDAGLLMLFSEEGDTVHNRDIIIMKTNMQGDM